MEGNNAEKNDGYDRKGQGYVRGAQEAQTLLEDVLEGSSDVY